MADEEIDLLGLSSFFSEQKKVFTYLVFRGDKNGDRRAFRRIDSIWF